MLVNANITSDALGFQLKVAKEKVKRHFKKEGRSKTLGGGAEQVCCSRAQKMQVLIKPLNCTG